MTKDDEIVALKSKVAKLEDTLEIARLELFAQAKAKRKGAAMVRIVEKEIKSKTMQIRDEEIGIEFCKIRNSVFHEYPQLNHAQSDELAAIRLYKQAWDLGREFENSQPETEEGEIKQAEQRGFEKATKTIRVLCDGKTIPISVARVTDEETQLIIEIEPFIVRNGVATVAGREICCADCHEPLTLFASSEGGGKRVLFNPCGNCKETTRACAVCNEKRAEGLHFCTGCYAEKVEDVIAEDRKENDAEWAKATGELLGKEYWKGRDDGRADLIRELDLGHVLNEIKRTDKTPKYEYSKTDERDADNGGNFPEKGKRWLMPREIADRELERLEAIKASEDKPINEQWIDETMPKSKTKKSICPLCKREAILAEGGGLNCSGCGQYTDNCNCTPVEAWRCDECGEEHDWRREKGKVEPKKENKELR